jgi:hypothetical protein
MSVAGITRNRNNVILSLSTNNSRTVVYHVAYSSGRMGRIWPIIGSLHHDEVSG